jgi:hypothetical protein
MGNEISSQNPRPPVQTQPQDVASKTASDDAKRAAENQAADAAKSAQATIPDVQAELGKPSDLSFEFLNVFQTVFQEGYENFQVPKGDAASDLHQQGGKEFQKELHVLKEFMREMQRLVKEQNLDVRNMIYRVKAEQGGVFWDKVQQILQKGLPLHQTVNFQKTQKELEMQARIAGAGVESSGDAERLKAAALSKSGSNPMLDLLKAESNPLTRMEAYVAIMQTLRQDGLQQSSDKMLSYLRHKWGMNEEQMQQFLQTQGWVYFQGPFPRKESELPNPWYLLIAVLVIPLAMSLGLGMLPSAAIGLLALLTVLFVKKRGSGK